MAALPERNMVYLRILSDRESIRISSYTHYETLLVCGRRARGSAGAHGFGKEIVSAARGMQAISHRKEELVGWRLPWAASAWWIMYE